MDDSIAVSDLSSAEVQDVLDLAVRLKKEYFDRGNPPLLEGKVLSMIFQKPSLWTRVSFDGAMRHLGGDALTIQEKLGKGKGSSMAFAGDGNKNRKRGVGYSPRNTKSASAHRIAVDNLAK